MANRAGRTLLKWVAGVVGALVVLVVALVLLLQSSAVSSRVKDLVVPRVSAALGREVTVEQARLHVLPHARVELAGMAVAGRPGEPPLAKLGAFAVGVRLWPLLTSLGKDVQVSEIRLVKPVINLVRAQDGTWNYEGLGGAKPAPAASPAAPPARAPAEGGGAAPSVVVGHAAIEDGEVRYVDALAGASAQVAVSKIDLSADDVGPGRPLAATITAAVVNPEKNFRLALRAAKLPESAAALGPGKYPALDGDLALDGLDLSRVRAFLPPAVTNLMTGGRVDASAKLATEEGKYHVDGRGKLSQVRLRGEPAQGGFELHAVVDPATGAGTAALEKIALQGPGVDLGGRVAADLKPPRVRFAIAGPLLDLGQVMGLLPQQEQAPKKPGPLLTAEQRGQVRALDVAGTIDVKKVVKGGLVAEDFHAKAILDRGVFVLQEARTRFFGGSVDAGGTRVDLAQANPRWNLKAKLDGVEVGQAMQAMSGSAPLSGKAGGVVDLDGAGVDWPTLQKVLNGHGTVELKQGVLHTADLGGQALGAVSQGLAGMGRSLGNKVSGSTGKTELRDVDASFTVKDGAMTLTKPMVLAAPFGGAQLGGKIGLDGALALQGTANLSKQAVQGAGAKLPGGGGLQVPLEIGGTLSKPEIGVDAQQAVAGLVAGAAKQKLQQVQQDVQEKAKVQARKGLGDMLRGLGK